MHDCQLDQAAILVDGLVRRRQGALNQRKQHVLERDFSRQNIRQAVLRYVGDPILAVSDGASAPAVPGRRFEQKFCRLQLAADGSCLFNACAAVVRALLAQKWYV